MFIYHPLDYDANRIQRINDAKYTSLFAYDDQNQRVVKYVKNNSANTAKTTWYLNQYYQLSNDVLVTKHVFVGSSRMLTKHAGGGIVFRTKPRNTRSYKGRPESKIPGNTKAEEHHKNPDNDGEQTNNGNGGSSNNKISAPGYIKKEDKGNRYANGQQPEQAGNGQGKRNGKANANSNDKGKAKQDGQHPGQGIYHRSERANEVAQNVYKNKNLQYLLEDPESPYYQGEEGSTDGSTDSGNCNEINAGCTAGEEEIEQYTGDEVVIIGDAKEQLFYYHPDHLGSTAYVTDGNGDLKEHLEYFPFGETWVREGGSKKTPYLYTSKEFDAETGLYYYGARYYDPRTSVWASADPILESYLDGAAFGVYESSNLALYSYARNNPVVLKDPDGNIIPFIIGAAVLIDKAMTAYDVGSDAMAVANGEMSAGEFMMSHAADAIPGARLAKKVVGAVKGMRGVQDGSKAMKMAETRTCSFAPDTPVTTPDGLKRIDQIKAGDSVLARDAETGEQDWKQVVTAYSSLHDDALALTLVNPDSGEEEKIVTTAEHPFYVENRGWMRADLLKRDDRIRTAGGGWVKVGSATWLQAEQLAYNMEVAGFHTYFVGAVGAWVHNSCGDEVTKKGTLPKPPTGRGTVPKSERDPKRLFTPSEREAKRIEQGHKCGNGCGTKIDESNSAGHHIERHADGGRTVPENHAEVCKDCHKDLHSKD